MKERKIYHEGELEVQAKVGVSREAEMLAGAMLQSIPPEIAHFIDQQTMAVVGSLDDDGRVWASVVFGGSGFIKALDEQRLSFQRNKCHSAAGDPLWRNLTANPQLGMLLIELISRRRLRINGRFLMGDDGNCQIEAHRLYANCPKYIQRRRMTITEIADTDVSEEWQEGRDLSAIQQDLISQADTFFVASAHPEQGVDASHRGGHAGFVQVLSPQRLRIPDFVGNNMFNTLGNFVRYPSAGLVFIDFEHGRLLQLSGRPKVLLNEADERGETGGTSRFWEFEIEIWRESRLPLKLEWKFLDYSPYLPEVQQDLDASDEASLSLRVEWAWMETKAVRCLQLVSADGGELPSFESGAHLPVQVRDKMGNWVERHYSLISNPADRFRYRIGVRVERDGRGGSLYLHNSLQIGVELEAKGPRNHFPLLDDADHLILLAGGIGITPLISMLYRLNSQGRGFELHYSAKHLSDLAFRREIELLAGERAKFYASAESGQPRLDLRRILSKNSPNTHVYVCGPRRLILAVRELAWEKGWSEEQIHFESFGIAPQPGDRGVSIELARSGKTVHVPASSSILDALLDEGVEVPHECKRGECSICKTRVLDGDPDHRDLCLTPEEQQKAICVCVSRAKGDRLKLDL
jgi:ferredoxin-NADP reductase